MHGVSYMCNACAAKSSTATTTNILSQDFPPLANQTAATI